jgi:hypothetical protein
MPTTIPGSLGLPFLGETLTFFSNPLAFFAKGGVKISFHRHVAHQPATAEPL